MRVTIIRTAYSSVVCQGHDFSCCLFDTEGQLVAQSEDLPGHVLPMSWSVRTLMEKFGGDMRPGDVFILNDPTSGGTHSQRRHGRDASLCGGAIVSHSGDQGPLGGCRGDGAGQPFRGGDRDPSGGGDHPAHPGVRRGASETRPPWTCSSPTSVCPRIAKGISEPAWPGAGRPSCARMSSWIVTLWTWFQTAFGDPSAVRKSASGSKSKRFLPERISTRIILRPLKTGGSFPSVGV